MKKKNVGAFNLVLSDKKIAQWLSSQRGKADIVQNALMFCLISGPGSEAYTSLFLPGSDRAPWPANGHAKPAAATARPATLPLPGNAMGDFK